MNFTNNLTDNSAMVAPITWSIPQIAVEVLEENVMKTIDFPIVVFKRYADDCITAMPNDKLHDLLKALNSILTN